MGPIAAQAVQLIHTQSMSQTAQSIFTPTSGGGDTDTRGLNPPNTLMLQSRLTSIPTSGTHKQKTQNTYVTRQNMPLGEAPPSTPMMMNSE